MPFESTLGAILAGVVAGVVVFAMVAGVALLVILWLAVRGLRRARAHASETAAAARARRAHDDTPRIHATEEPRARTPAPRMEHPAGAAEVLERAARRREAEANATDTT